MDRNLDIVQGNTHFGESLSARRAWIETQKRGHELLECGSLSARRAWIETAVRPGVDPGGIGSLSARRAWIETCRAADPNRP